MKALSVLLLLVAAPAVAQIQAPTIKCEAIKLEDETITNGINRGVAVFVQEYNYQFKNRQIVSATEGDRAGVKKVWFEENLGLRDEAGKLCWVIVTENKCLQDGAKHTSYMHSGISHTTQRWRLHQGKGWRGSFETLRSCQLSIIKQAVEAMNNLVQAKTGGADTIN